MANEVLGDALSTTMTLPVREATKRKPIENIEEDLTPVTFTDPIPKSVPPEPKAKGQTAGDLYKSDIQASVDALETGRKLQFQLDSDKAVNEAERLATKAYKASQSSAQQRKEIEQDPARQEYKDALSEKSKPFIPNEQNANDMMMLFGLLNVVGFAIGSGGKENAQAAMSAMNGMLEGNRKGREDLYKKEKSIFETNQRQLDSRIKQLQAFMQDNQLLYGMDKTARDQAIESEFLQTGATFMLEYYRKRGAGPTLEFLEQTVKTMQEVSKLTRAETVRAEDRAREDVQKADERKFRLDTAAQQENAARNRAREDRLFQISVKEQELAAAEDRDIRNKTFESAMAVEKNRIELLMQKENYRHAEAQSDRVMNHATAIQTETILARKAKESQDAADRAQDKTEQAARDRATETYRAEEQKARIAAEKLRLEHQKADDVHKTKMLALEARRVAVAEKGAGGAGKTSALLAGRAENIREAFAQAAADIVNITKFPKGTMLGSFAGLTGASADSMVGAIRNGIARGVTQKEQRMLEALLTGIEGHMAFALGGGYATSQSKARMDQYKAQLARAGDDPAQVPLMLARFRQEMNILAENFESKPGATSEMNKAVQKYNDQINVAVPFTVDDVLNAELGTGKSVARPKTDAEFNALPKGARYIDPDDGKEYRKK